METLFYNISQVLGITIIHSLWQGLLIYMVIRLLFIGFPSASSGKKHNALFIALSCMALWFAGTFFVEAKAYNWTVNSFQQPTLQTGLTPIDAVKIAPPAQQTAPAFFDNFKHFIKTYLPYISLFYIIGLAINLGRLTMAWQNIRAIKKTSAAAGKLQQLVNDLSQRLDISKHVHLSFSDLVDVPCIMGYVKPILLLPVTITTQLSAEEIEDILLHELAHVKNNDYLLNLIQQVITMLLFLNPFAQLISRMISRERENRCDDMVLQLTGNPLIYARALVKLEKTRQHNLQLALAATGSKYHLFARIERIMKTNKPVVNTKHLILAMLIFIGSLGSLAWLNPEIKDGKLTSNRGSKAIIQLEAIVKNVISKNDEQVVTAKLAVIAPKTDSSKVNINPILTDTVLTVQQRDALINEYRQVSKDLDEQQDIVQNLPESKQSKIAQHILDSVRHAITKEKLTPDLVQQQKEKSELFQKYLNSAQYKQLKEKYNVAIAKFFEVLNRQPEMSAYNTIYFKQVDSIYTALQQQTGLSKSDVSKIPEFQLWGRQESTKRMALQMKMLAIPEVKAANDSLENAGHMLSYNPEWEEINKKTKASDEYMAAIDPTTGLELYRKAVKDAADKLHVTSAWKKMDAYIKRYDDIVDKLYGRKPKQLKP